MLFTTPSSGHTMAQAVSRQPVIAEGQVHALFSRCGIFDGQSSTGTGSLRFLWFSPVHIIPSGLHTLLSSRGWTKGPSVAAVQRQSHPNMKNKQPHPPYWMLSVSQNTPWNTLSLSHFCSTLSSKIYHHRQDLLLLHEPVCSQSTSSATQESFRWGQTNYPRKCFMQIYNVNF
jgi:hypothetical protein